MVEYEAAKANCVFPAGAGVIPRHQKSTLASLGVSRRRGGDPNAIN